MTPQFDHAKEAAEHGEIMFFRGRRLVRGLADLELRLDGQISRSELRAVASAFSQRQISCRSFGSCTKRYNSGNKTA